MTGSDTDPPRIDTSRPHPARVYDWWPGGKDTYPADEEPARKILAVDGWVPRGARADRRFMRRSTRGAAEAGTRQFLDIVKRPRGAPAADHGRRHRPAHRAP